MPLRAAGRPFAGRYPHDKHPCVPINGYARRQCQCHNGWDGKFRAQSADIRVNPGPRPDCALSNETIENGSPQ